MNDFDFEELDKAVNNLASKTHDEHGGPDPVAAPVVVTTTPVASEPKPEAAKPEPVTPASTSLSSAPAVKSTSAPAKHRLGDTRTRRGSFMDIVPPTPRKTPARVGVSVQPLSKAEEVVPEAPAPTPSPAKVEPEEPALPDLSDLKLDLDTEPKMPEPTVQAKPVEPQPPLDEVKGDKKSSSEVAWPDPLDFDDAKPTAPKTETEPAESVSPFLAEAKVEKRPLGAFSNFRPAEPPKPVDEPPKPEPKEPKVKDELTPEADGTLEELKKDKAPLPPKEGEKTEDKESTKPDVHGAAMMAIPDQYRPEPKTTDKTPRPVYDTKEYHPPLIEATSHEHRGGGSMWGKIFIALVALALIAVAGYFAYIYFVQQ